MELCALCGRPAQCHHHLIFGRQNRHLCEEDKECCVIPMCNECHNLALKSIDRIHGNGTAEKLSKMLGQALWERNHIIECISEEQLILVRQAFMDRYGRSYL